MVRYESLEPYLNKKSICIKEIDSKCTKDEIKGLLLKVCPQGMGSICVPVDKATQVTLGQAYCNFDDKKDAKIALEKWRYTLKIRNKPVRLMYAVNTSIKVAKAKVFEKPGCLKHFVVIKNMSEQVDEKTLYQTFSAYGEILQCFVERDRYGQPYGHVQYIEESACEEAVDRANGTAALGHHTILTVQRNSRAHAAGSQSEAAPSLQASDFPSLGGRPSTSNTPAAPTSHTPTLDSDGFPIYDPAAFEDTSSEHHDAPAYDPNFAAAYEPRRSNPSIPHADQAPLSPPTPNDARMLPQQQQAFNEMPIPQMFTNGSNPTPTPPPMPHLIHQLAQMQRTPIPGMAPHPNGAPFLPPLQAMLQQQQMRMSTPAAATAPPRATPTPTGIPMPTAAITAPAALPKPATSAPPPPPPAAAAAAPRVQLPAASAKLAAALKAGKAGAGPQQPAGNIRAMLKDVLSKYTAQIESHMCCPITQEVFTDPVVAADGHTYERSAITQWLQTHDTSPMTNEEMANKVLYPNNLVKVLCGEVL